MINWTVSLYFCLYSDMALYNIPFVFKIFSILTCIREWQKLLKLASENDNLQKLLKLLEYNNKFLKFVQNLRLCGCHLVLFDFKGLVTHMTNFLTVSLSLDTLRRWMCILSLVFLLNIYGFKLTFVRILWRIIHELNLVLYDVNFGLINMDLFGLSHAINWISSLPSNTHGGFHIVIQVSVSFSSLSQLCSFSGIWHLAGVDFRP